MLNFFFKTCIVLLGIAFVPVNGVYADLQSGFGGIAWGAPMEQVGDCEKVAQTADILYCGRRKQAHTVLGEAVERVTYGFYKDNFFAVFIRIENDSLYSQVQSRLTARLGPPERQLDAQGSVARMIWLDGKVQTELMDDHDEQGFKLAFYYLPIAESLLSGPGTIFPARRPVRKLFPIKKGDMPDAVRILEF